MLNRDFAVYGVGNAIMDIQLQVSEEEFNKLGLEKAAMKLVEVEEQKRLVESFHGRDLNQASGGSAANSMIALAQLGGKSAYGCTVGDDEYGRFYFEEMEQLGVKLHTAPLGDEVTGTCIILVTPDAERTMNTHLGASTSFEAAHVSEEMIQKSEWLYIEGYLFSSESGQGVVRESIALAKKHGVKVAITFSDGFIVDVFGEPLREAVASADLVFANFNEAKRFTGAEQEDDVFAALCEAVPNVAMTMSERGARLYFDGSEHRLDAFDVRAIDETGAGDMFAGGFLYGITHGMSGQEAGKLACFLASKVVSQLGPRLLCDVKALLAEEEFLPLAV